MCADARLGTVVGSYRITAFVGRGGMGVVYEAEHTRLKRRAALKILAPEIAGDPDFRTRFDRESELAAALEHPNIIPVYDAGEDGGVLYIAMRYVEGRNLQEVLNREGPLPVARALEIVRQLAAALDAAHRRNLIHRDVKPGNVMLEPREDGTDHAFLTDFGLVKRLDTTAQLTKTGMFTGTPDYASPEQIRGEELDGRSDQYSLGCVLVAALTGRPPFERDDHVATMYGHITDTPPRVSAGRADVPAELDGVVERGMAKNRDDRFPSCTALVTAASDAVTGGATALAAEAPPAPPAMPVAPGPPPPEPPTMPVGHPPAPAAVAAPEAPDTRPTRPHRRRRGRMVVAAIVAVALVAGGVAVGIRLTSGDSNGSATGSPGPSEATRRPSGAPGALAPSVFLDDPKSFARPHIDGTASFQPGAATISGRTLPHSLIFGFDNVEPFTATYRLPGTYSAFVAWIGLDDEAGVESVRFDILIDESPQPPREVSPGTALEYRVQLPDDAKTLTLSMRPGTCPNILQCDTQAIWASAALEGAGPPPTTPAPPTEPDQPLRKLSDEGRMHILDVDGAPQPSIADSVTLDGTTFLDSFIYDLDCSSFERTTVASTSWDLDGSFRSLDVRVGLEKVGRCQFEVQFFRDYSLQTSVPVNTRTPPVHRTIPLSGAGLLRVDLVAVKCEETLNCSAKVVLGDPTLKGTA